MAKKRNKVQRSVSEELHELIVPAFDLKALKDRGLPANEIEDFQRYKIVPAELLENAPWNYRENDEEMDDALESNIARQGQVENLNVRMLPSGKFQVGNGNHRNNIFQRNGRKFVLVCDHGQVSEAEFKRRVIEQNDTRYGTDTMRLAAIMKELVGEFTLEELAESMPYTEEEIEDFTSLLTFSFDQYSAGSNLLEGNEDPDTKTFLLEVSDEEAGSFELELNKIIKQYKTAKML